MEYPDQYRVYIRRLCDFLKQEVFAQEYWIDLEFHETLESSDAEKVCAANISIDGTYLEATLRISDHCYDLYQKQQWTLIGRVLVHEYCHFLTEPLYRIAADLVAGPAKQFLDETRERQTQRIANVLFNRIPEDIWIPEATEPRKRKSKK